MHRLYPNHAQASGAARGLVIVDETLALTRSLLPVLHSGCDVAVLPRTGVMMDALTDQISDCAPLDTLVLILGGGPGYMRIGGQTIDQPALDWHADSLHRWRTCLSDQASLILQVDRIGEGLKGAGFLRRFQSLLQRAVRPGFVEKP